jgi:predicted Fe-Mo cluster-binding NifX family protein
MRIAIPMHSGRIAPVFDTATSLLLVDVETGEVVSRREAMLTETDAMRRTQSLRDLGVGVLICGAVSRELATSVQTAGIAMLPWTAGPVEEVLTAYLAQQLPDPRWRMPGCSEGRPREDSGRRGRRSARARGR